MIGPKQNAKYPYIVSLVGVALMAVTTIYGAARAMMMRAAFRVGVGGTRQFGNSQFGGAFGFTNILSVLAIIIAVAGLLWLGLVLRHSQPASA